MSVRRVFVQKKKGFDIEANSIFKDLKNNLLISGLKSVRVLNRYDVEGISDEEYLKAKTTIFSEPPVDDVFDEAINIMDDEKVVAIEFLPGQYDQRADSAAQCIQILTQGEKPAVKVAKIIIMSGEISEEDYTKIKTYCINPVESQEASMKKPETLVTEYDMPEDVKSVDGFIGMSDEDVYEYMNQIGFAMSFEDLKFCQKYFKEEEKRNPTVTELKVIDTYWSDHCRHTTFLTQINDVQFEEGRLSNVIKETYQEYLNSRQQVYADRQKDISLMDIATLAMKELRRQGKLEDLDISEEINACSINVNVDIDGKMEEWLVMFKNETHNHPTEIEPFGGAATCLGGAIRDPLSGRSFVYQAMRVTGSGDPRVSVKDTLAGKLPQRKITTTAAHGYSSYGNQIGLATGQVAEIYDPGYVTKRMEIGAVIAAAPKKNVVREVPLPGDIIVLLGGRTGRDGCGGATGSSKEHTEDSLESCGAEVQKGNPPTERKIQRLFRDPIVSTMIKRCNDFGAGGVCVAIGELADGLDIDLDAVPKKYQGLDGTELAISESQERMAVVLKKEDVESFILKARAENLEAVQVAEVTAKNRLVMNWRGSSIVNVSRDFLNTNGVKQTAEIKVVNPDEEVSFFDRLPNEVVGKEKDIQKAWLNNLSRLNVCSQKGLVEMFDSTIGANTVLMPFGGKTQLTPAEGMAAKIPVLDGETTTGTLMSFGYNPELAKWSPFHGALYAVVESVAKIVAMGGDYKKIRLTLQEYFEKLGKDSVRWGKPFSALLGAFHAQLKLGIPAIGGKDSMSGTFKDMDVPPTLVSFAVDTVNVKNVISPEFKRSGSKVILLSVAKDKNLIPDFDMMDKTYNQIHKAINDKKIISASTVKFGGVAESISKMCFGNMLGFKFDSEFISNSDKLLHKLFMPEYSSIVVELNEGVEPKDIFEGLQYEVIGITQIEQCVTIGKEEIPLYEMIYAWESTLEKIFPTKTDSYSCAPVPYSYERFTSIKSHIHIAKPRVFIPVFPGTNTEYETAKVFEKAGAKADVFVINNLSGKEIEASIKIMADKINQSQIVMIPGGFSGGDEPDGSGKFIATAFRNPIIKEAVMNLIKNRDGLMLGICNGFQALIKLGLVPFGEIRDIDHESPTLTFNTVGRHASCLVNTKVVSSISPWLKKAHVGDIHTVAVSHGEGRFVASDEILEQMMQNGQIATQYVDFEGNPTYDIRYNPNGSIQSIEGITSPDGRIFGKMGHSERSGSNVFKNVPGEKDQRIFESGVEYFL